MKRLFIGDIKFRLFSSKSLNDFIKEKIPYEPLEIERSPAYRGYFVYYKEGTMKAENWFFKFNKDDRWLDNPYEIGGRSVDISQIALSLEDRIRELFPINEVPDNVVHNLKVMRLACEQAEKEIDAFIDFFSKYRWEEKFGR